MSFTREEASLPLLFLVCNMNLVLSSKKTHDGMSNNAVMF